ncbi:MAG: hypothetical protein GY797_36355, partial [Deltaproteobacteria bacterium]|nr:hypothetical protein [Deltaproteobacteria bacterium]
FASVAADLSAIAFTRLVYNLPMRQGRARDTKITKAGDKQMSIAAGAGKLVWKHLEDGSVAFLKRKSKEASKGRKSLQKMVVA